MERNSFLEKIVQNAKKGHMESFEQLVSIHEKTVYNIVYRMIGDPEEAKDLTQETFIKIFTNISKFKGQSSFSTWIYRIAMNICIDELRKKKKNIILPMHYESGRDDDISQWDPADRSPTPEDNYINLEKREEILKVLNALNSDFKSILVLRDIQGFSYADISGILNVSPGAVKSRLNRARRRFKEIYEHVKEQNNNYARLKDQEGGKYNDL